MANPVLTAAEQINELELKNDRSVDALRAAEKDANDARLAAEKALERLADAEAKAVAAIGRADEALAQARQYADVLEDAQTRASAAEDVAEAATARADHVQESLDAQTADNKAAKERIRALENEVASQAAELQRLRPIAEHAAALVEALG